MLLVYKMQKILELPACKHINSLLKNIFRNILRDDEAGFKVNTKLEKEVSHEKNEVSSIWLRMFEFSLRDVGSEIGTLLKKSCHSFSHIACSLLIIRTNVARQLVRVVKETD